MSDLEQSELEAIRDAVSDGGSKPVAGGAQPLALIAEDRAAIEARPAGGHLGTRWATKIVRQLRHLAEVQATLSGSETVEGGAAIEGLGRTWSSAFTIEGRRGRGIIAVGGGLINVLAAKMLGAKEVDPEEAGDVPSPSSLRVFGPVGHAIADCLAQVWHEDHRCEVAFDDTTEVLEAARLDLAQAEIVVKITIGVEGAGTGRACLIARPSMLVPSPREMAAVSAAADIIAEALGAVPVELRVELGRTVLPMSRVRALEVGEVLTLTGFVDDPLPVECAGVVKAWGRPIVYRGVLGVELCPPPADQTSATENES